MIVIYSVELSNPICLARRPAHTSDGFCLHALCLVTGDTCWQKNLGIDLANTDVKDGELLRWFELKIGIFQFFISAPPAQKIALQR